MFAHYCIFSFSLLCEQGVSSPTSPIQLSTEFGWEIGTFELCKFIMSIKLLPVFMYCTCSEVNRRLIWHDITQVK